VDVLCDADSAALSTKIAELREESFVVVTDLSLGAWQAQHVARELRAQLGLPTRSTLEDAGRRHEELLVRGSSYADITASAVAAEAAGDAKVSVAAAAAEQIADAVRERGPHTILVVAPRFGLPWEDDDILLLDFLTRLLGPDEVRVFVAVASDARSLPRRFHVRHRARARRTVPSTQTPMTVPLEPVAATSIVALVPGLVQKKVQASLDAALPGAVVGLLSIGEGFALVAPEHRRPLASVPVHEFDWLAVVSAPFPWLAAFAQCFSSRELVDPRLLSAEASRRWAEGAASVALRMGVRAIDSARTNQERDALQCWVQGVRIAAHRFDELADAPDPPVGSAPATQGFLHEAKGWGLVMSGQAHEAGAHFKRAQELLSPHSGSREFLYLLNISALGQLRSGDAVGALTLEETIAERAALLDPRDWSLEYLNALNLARLRKYLGDVEGAYSDYRRAFDVTLGTRSDSERVYSNVVLGRAAAASGRLEVAFFCALRASLHWLSSRIPEAIGSRTLAAILARPWPLTSRPTIAEVAGALEAELTDAAVAFGRPAIVAAVHREGRAPIPAFVGGELSPLQDEVLDLRAVGTEGIGLLVTDRRVRTPQAPDGRLRLGALTRDLLEALCPDAGIEAAGTIVVEENHGREVPTSAAELLDVCIRRGLRRMVFSDRGVGLDDACRSHLERASLVTLGPAVAGIDGGDSGRRIRFKRVLAPLLLGDGEDRVVSHLSERSSIAGLASRLTSEGTGDDVVRLVRTLEGKRALEVHLTKSACAEAGF
jgi:tetratricopeptide (TPR) repeat protein